MKKLFLIPTILLVSVSAVLAAIWVNLDTGSIGVPARIDNVCNPIADPEFLYTKAYRQADEPAAPAEGYERLSQVTWIQDPTNATRALPVYHDTLVADRLAREYAQDLEANFTKYVYQNVLLLICDSISAQTNHAKLPLDTITGILLQVRAVDKPRYETLRDSLNTLNAGLIRYDTLWWDTCVWRSETNVVTAATNMFGLFQ